MRTLVADGAGVGFAELVQDLRRLAGRQVRQSLQGVAFQLLHRALHQGSCKRRHCCADVFSLSLRHAAEPHRCCALHLLHPDFPAKEIICFHVKRCPIAWNPSTRQ